MIDKETIKPKIKGKSDFFSWQLFRWIRKNPEYYHIWKTDKDILVIGQEYDDSISGTHLRQFCHFGNKLTVWSFCLYDTSKWKDVTDWFWKEYMRKGVCAIHGDNAHEWDTVGDLRACQYCDKAEIQKTRMVEHKYWQET